MRRIALLNPNTNADTTDAMVEIAKDAAAPGFEIVGVTAEAGVPLITEPFELAAAADAVAALAPQLSAQAYDAIIVAAFSDPGHEQLASSLAPIPVVGIGEASMREAARLSNGRFAVVNVLPRLTESIRKVAEESGCGAALISVREPDMDTAAVTAAIGDARASEEMLAALITQAVESDNVQAVVIGGGPLARAARALAPRFERCPIIEPIPAAVQAAMARLASMQTNLAGDAGLSEGCGG